SPTHEGNFRLGVYLIVALALVAAGALLGRQRGRAFAVLVCAAGALACYAVWVLGGPPVPISGLAIAFPAGWATLWAVQRQDVATPARRFAAVSVVVFIVAVVFTQYPGGGGPEWGGRFFVLGLG